MIITYLETGVLSSDEKLARRVALTQPQYVVEDRVLYRLEGDGTLRVIPPTQLREWIFQEAHGGRLGAHLGDLKVYSQLRRHFWWNGMRADIARWSRASLVCATHSSERPVRPPLTPIPVSRRVGVDVVQFPRLKNGNQYAVVFVYYLTKWPEVFPVPNQS